VVNIIIIFQGFKISRLQSVRGHRPPPRRPSARVENLRLEVHPGVSLVKLFFFVTDDTLKQDKILFVQYSFSKLV